MSSLLNVIDVGNRSLANAEVVLLGFFFEDLNLAFGIDLAGRVHHTDVFSVRINLNDQLEQAVNRSHIGRAGDIGTRLVIALNEFGDFKIGHGGCNDRNLIGRISHCLSSRRCDCSDQIYFVARKTGGNVAQVGLVGLGILKIKFDVLAFYETLGGESVDKTLVSGVQSLMFDKLNHTDVIRFSGRGLSCGSSCFFIIAAGNGQDCG